MSAGNTPLCTTAPRRGGIPALPPTAQHRARVRARATVPPDSDPGPTLPQHATGAARAHSVPSQRSAELATGTQRTPYRALRHAAAPSDGDGERARNGYYDHGSTTWRARPQPYRAGRAAECARRHPGPRRGRWTTCTPAIARRWGQAPPSTRTPSAPFCRTPTRLPSTATPTRSSIAARWTHAAHHTTQHAAAQRHHALRLLHAAHCSRDLHCCTRHPGQRQSSDHVPPDHRYQQTTLLGAASLPHHDTARAHWTCQPTACARPAGALRTRTGRHGGSSGGSNVISSATSPHHAQQRVHRDRAHRGNKQTNKQIRFKV